MSTLYGLLMELRRWAYGKQLFSSLRPPMWTISVGNLSMGGTGKTPILDWILERLEKRGLRIVVVSKGYRSRSKEPRFVDPNLNHAALEYGDESTWLAERHPRVPVVVGPRKRSNVEYAMEVHNPQVLLIDDGFQTLSVGRDRDLVLVDASRPFGEWRVFPWGRLREWASGLRRASAIVLTKTNWAPKEQVEEYRRKIQEQTGAPRYEFEFLVQEPTPFRPQGGRSRPERWVVVSGIAHGEFFLSQVRRFGEIKKELRFKDHHNYTERDFNRIDEALGRDSTTGLLTTAKDAVKLGAEPRLRERLWTAELKPRALFDEEEFFRAILPTHP